MTADLYPDLWLVASLDLGRLASTAPQLDPAQQAKIAAMQNPARREQCLAARALACQLLNEAGADALIGQHDNGRPHAVHWPYPLGLSWSHTARWAAAALGVGRVGIDVETLRTRRNLLELAHQYFDPREAAWLATLAGEQQLLMFYTLWVAKEALLKALGTGIVGGLGRYVLLPDAGGWQLHSPAGETWHLHVWQLPEKTLLAVAHDQAQTLYLQADGAVLQLEARSQAYFTA